MQPARAKDRRHNLQWPVAGSCLASLGSRHLTAQEMQTLTVVALHGDKPASGNMRTNRQRNRKFAGVTLDHVFGPNKTHRKMRAWKAHSAPIIRICARQPGNEAKWDSDPSKAPKCLASVYMRLFENRESHCTSILVLSHGSKPHGSKSGPTPQRLHPAMRVPCLRVLSCTQGPIILKSHSPIISIAGTPTTFHIMIATADRPLSSHITARRLEPVYHIRCRK